MAAPVTHKLPMHTTSLRPASRSLRPASRRLAVPSYVASTVLHAGVIALAVLLSQTKSCQPDIGTGEGDTYREVGIVLKPPAPEQNDQPPAVDAETMPAVSDATTAESQTVDALAQPPVPLQTPTSIDNSIIGMGGPPSVESGSAQSLIQPRAQAAGGIPSQAASGGATSLFGIRDNGRRFVYVIDRSGSTGHYGALRVAKAELKASLQALSDTQQFQVIFYNTGTVVLDTRQAKFDLFFGTDVQRSVAGRQIDAITPAGATRHLTALETAIRLEPDVIFLLTDAGDPLMPKELSYIQSRNRSAARIHCIEFGEGPVRGQAPGSFLRKLASQNDGRYVYRDVTQFQTP